MQNGCASGRGTSPTQRLTYRQAANALAELHLTELDPLDLAIPELRVDQKLEQELTAKVAELADALA